PPSPQTTTSATRDALSMQLPWRVSVNSGRYNFLQGQFATFIVQMLWGERRGWGKHRPRQPRKRRYLVNIALFYHTPNTPTPIDHSRTFTAVVELSKRNWLVPGHVPGVERRPLKRTEGRAADLLRILTTWREKAEQAGRTITRFLIAFEAGRDGFWLARWLRRN